MKNLFQKALNIISNITGLFLFVFSTYQLILTENSFYTIIMLLSILILPISSINRNLIINNDIILSILRRQEYMLQEIKKMQEDKMSIANLLNPKNLFNPPNSPLLSSIFDPSKLKNIPSISIDLEKDEIQTNGDVPPELMKMMENVSNALKAAIEKEQEKEIQKMDVDELHNLLNKAVQEEDYAKATFLRDEIQKRQSSKNHDENEDK